MARTNPSRSGDVSTLAIRDLHVYYGQSHALQGVDLTLDHGVHAVIGRNGMGKTTLCNAIMGLLPVQRGSIRFNSKELVGLPPYKIAGKGIGYTPQGRRLWPDLSVHEHLALSQKPGGSWTSERIYDTFPRLAERRRNGAAQLSGGEQQMLAISRALLQDPRLLILDEPTEGLAPVIVDHLQRLLADLAAQQDVAVLLIEQNIAVATSISEDVAIMVNGRIDRVMPSVQLAADRTLQERLLGVGRHSHEPAEIINGQSVPDNEPEQTTAMSAPGPSTAAANQQKTSEDAKAADQFFVPATRWSRESWVDRQPTRQQNGTDETTDAQQVPFSQIPMPLTDSSGERAAPASSGKPVSTAALLSTVTSTATTVAGAISPAQFSASSNTILVAGTFDTKAIELGYIRDQISARGLRVKTVDLSTSGQPSSADIPPHMLASYHSGGANAVFTNERGASIREMSIALAAWIVRQRDIAGIISAGGSGATALATPAMRALPVGLPKLMVSTLASGDVAQYVGPVDITMMYSVTDVQGLNQISRQVLANAANAIAGMVEANQKNAVKAAMVEQKPGLGLTMFGVTTTAIQQITSQLQDQYECMVFHATGTGGRSMEKLVDSGVLTAAIDLTTTEICDMMMGGFFAADEDRFGAFIRTGIPYVGSVGALDMVNFLSPETVPARYKDRTFVEHNPQVTLMRTTADENARMGEWIAERLNKMNGPVRFLLPEGGVSALDAPDQAFYDPAADAALFDAISQRFETTANRQLIRIPHHINAPAFATAAIAHLEDIQPAQQGARYARH
ncbi:MAG: ABC transporter permease [Granulosicoccus sp.]